MSDLADIIRLAWVLFRLKLRRRRIRRLDRQLDAIERRRVVLPFARRTY